MKIVVIGGVMSTKVLVDKLFDFNFENVTVYGFVPRDHSLVSGWVDLSYCQERGYVYIPFQQINRLAEEIAKSEPDYIFVVGLSQLVSYQIIKAAKYYAIGFHPTVLPKGRGRAPLAWITERCEDGAATFFELTEFADEGQIFIQKPFTVTEQDDAKSVEQKLLTKEGQALDELLVAIKNHSLKGTPQDESLATFNGKRMPLDGCLNWEKGAYQIDRLIKASTDPHPGAFTFYENIKINIWQSEVLYNSPYTGIVGTIQRVDKSSFIIQCLDECIKVNKWTTDLDWIPKVGMRLGYIPAVEIYELRQEVKQLSKKIEVLESLINKKK